jgi:hypothetical protein
MKMERSIACDGSAHLNSVVLVSSWLPWQTGITVESVATPWYSANQMTNEIKLCKKNYIL